MMDMSGIKCAENAPTAGMAIDPQRTGNKRATHTGNKRRIFTRFDMRSCPHVGGARISRCSPFGYIVRVFRVVVYATAAAATVAAASRRPGEIAYFGLVRALALDV